MSPETEIEMLRRHASMLSEHFDSVRIFVTRQMHDGTVSVTEGAGNFQAQQGQVREWLIRQDENTRENARRGYDTTA